MKRICLILSALLLSVRCFGQSTDNSSKNDNFYIPYFREEGIVIDSCTNLALLYEVCGWLETPYHYAHSTRYSTDCSGLIKGVYQNVYGTALFGGSRDLFTQCDPIEKKRLIPGDLIFFKINKSEISHIGLYLGDNKFVHASTKRGVVMNDLDEKYYKAHYYKAGRLRRTKMNKMTKFDSLIIDPIEK